MLHLRGGSQACFANPRRPKDLIAEHEDTMDTTGVQWGTSSHTTCALENHAEGAEQNVAQSFKKRGGGLGGGGLVWSPPPPSTPFHRC